MLPCQLRAYLAIPNIPGNYTYHTVNHSPDFVNPLTGRHTQHVESYWSRVKRSFKRMNGISKDLAKDLVPNYMDEFMWHERYGKTNRLAYMNILRHIAERYSCWVTPSVPPL